MNSKSMVQLRKSGPKMASAVRPSMTMTVAVKWEPLIMMSREYRGEPLTPINLLCVQVLNRQLGMPYVSIYECDSCTCIKEKRTWVRKYGVICSCRINWRFIIIFSLSLLMCMTLLPEGTL